MCNDELLSHVPSKVPGVVRAPVDTTPGHQLALPCVHGATERYSPLCRILQRATPNFCRGFHTHYAVQLQNQISGQRNSPCPPSFVLFISLCACMTHSHTQYQASVAADSPTCSQSLLRTSTPLLRASLPDADADANGGSGSVPPMAALEAVSNPSVSQEGQVCEYPYAGSWRCVLTTNTSSFRPHTLVASRLHALVA